MDRLTSSGLSNGDVPELHVAIHDGQHQIISSKRTILTSLRAVYELGSNSLVGVLSFSSWEGSCSVLIGKLGRELPRSKSSKKHKVALLNSQPKG